MLEFMRDNVVYRAAQCPANGIGFYVYLFVFSIFILTNCLMLTAQCPARGIGSCFIPGFVESPPVSGNPTTPLFQTYKNVE